MTQKSTVAVIGHGHLGTAIARNLIRGNRSVIIAGRQIGKATELAHTLGNRARPLDIPDAIRQAEIIVLAVWFDGIKELFDRYAAELRGKIIIDPSNPIAPDERGGFKKIIGEKESAGEILSTLLPDNAKLVKAFGTLGVASLTDAAFQKPDPAVLFYAADDKTINPEIGQLIRDCGFEPLHIGGIDQSIHIEVFGDLHEFGALGRTVTAGEALEKLHNLHTIV